MPRNKNRFKLIILVAFFVGGLVFCLHEREWLKINPFEREIPLINAAYAMQDSQGNMYISDNGMQRILKISPKGEILARIQGGSRERGSLYIAHDMSVDEAGTIYCANTVRAIDGLSYVNETLLQFSTDGTLNRELYNYPYNDPEKRHFYEQIKNTKIVNGLLHYIYADEDGIVVYRHEGENFVETKRFAYPQAGRLVLHGDISADGQTLYVTTKRGEVLEHNGTEVRLRYQGNDRYDDLVIGCVPWDVTVDDTGRLFFSDAASGELWQLDEHNNRTLVLNHSSEYGPVPMKGQPYYGRIWVSPDGETILAADRNSVVFKQGGVTKKITSTRISMSDAAYAGMIWLVSLCVLAAALGLTFLLGYHLFKRGLASLTRRTLSAFVLSLVVSVAVSAPLILDYYETLDKQVANGLSDQLVTATALIDADMFDTLRGLSDYDGPAYNFLRTRLDHVVNHSFSTGGNLYYVLYRTNGKHLFLVMDSTEVGVGSTLDRNYKGSEFEQAFLENKPVIITDTDAEGTWLNAVAPVLDSTKRMIGFVEIGRNAQALTEARLELLVDIVLLVLTSVVVVMMCFSEGIRFVDALKQRAAGMIRATQPGEAPWVPGVEIVRPLTFCLLLATHLEAVFLPVYVKEIYTTMFGLPPLVGMGIPVAAEVVATSLFAVVGGYVMDRVGVKKMLYIGAVTGIAGFILSAILMNVWVFTLGKLVTGSGMGLILVALETYVAELGNEEQVQKGFVEYYAAYYSTINIGCVTGGTLAMLVGYRGTYYIAAGLMLICLATISLFMRNVPSTPRPLPSVAEPAATVGVLGFVLNARVFAFFTCLYVPYLIGSYFLFYYFPLFANEQGLSEGRTAQIFLLNGLAITYLGASLVPLVSRVLGNIGAAVLGSLLCFGAMLVFTRTPTVAYAVMVVLVMGVSDSFSFSTQTSYFNSLSAVRRYGVAKANGLKTTVENLAYSSAPFAIGSALLFGMRGFGVLALGFTALTGIFVSTLFWRRSRASRARAQLPQRQGRG